MKAICPATVSITMSILRQWESAHSLRRVALNCYALMVIVLQKSSPEEVGIRQDVSLFYLINSPLKQRQIDLVTLVQLYCDALQELLATKHFDSGDANFDIASEADQDVVIDMAALSCTVAAVKLFLTGDADVSSEAICDSNLMELLIGLPKVIKPWHISHSSSLCSTMEALGTLSSYSAQSAAQLRQGERIERLFGSLREFGCPSVTLLDACFSLGYDDKRHLLLLPEVMLQLLNWVPRLQEREQLHVTNLVLKGCTDNYGT